MDRYCICVAVGGVLAADWNSIAVVVDNFGFMRWNHASLGRPGTGRRHYRNRTRAVVSGVAVMAVMIVLLVVMLVATAVAAAVRKRLRRMAHSRVLMFRSHAAAAAVCHAIGGAIVL